MEKNEEPYFNLYLVCYVGFSITLPTYFLHLSWVCELIRIVVDVVPGDTVMCYIGWLYYYPPLFDQHCSERSQFTIPGVDRK